MKQFRLEVVSAMLWVVQSLCMSLYVGIGMDGAALILFARMQNHTLVGTAFIIGACLMCWLMILDMIKHQRLDDENEVG